MKHVPLLIGLTVFYLYGFLWLLKPRKIKSLRDLYELFYIDFLVLKPEYVEIVKLNDSELITISRNPCPILRLAQALKMDTRYVCKLVSETVCKYVLKRINSKLVFERDYNYIRPYSDGCLERIYIEAQA